MVLLCWILTSSRGTTLIVVVWNSVACCSPSTANPNSSRPRGSRSVGLILVRDTSDDTISTPDTSRCWVATASEQGCIPMRILNRCSGLNHIGSSTASTAWHWHLVSVLHWSIGSWESILLPDVCWRSLLLLPERLISSDLRRWWLRLLVEFVICECVGLGSLKLLDGWSSISSTFIVAILLQNWAFNSLDHCSTIKAIEMIVHLLTHACKIDALARRTSVWTHCCDSVRGLVIVSLQISLLSVLHIVIVSRTWSRSSKVRSSVHSWTILGNSIVVVTDWSLISDDTWTILTDASRDTLNSSRLIWAWADLASSSNLLYVILITVLVSNNIVKILHLLVLIKLIVRFLLLKVALDRLGILRSWS